MGNGDIFVLAAVYLTGLGCKFWVVFCGLWFQYQFHFQRHLQCFSDLSHVYTTQWPVWDQGCDLYHSRVFKVYSILFSVRFTYTQGWAQQSISIFMGSFPKLLLLCDCLSTFLFLGGSPFLSFGQKAGALFIPLCDILPVTSSVSGAKWWRTKQWGFVPVSWHHIRKEGSPPSAF